MVLKRSGLFSVLYTAVAGIGEDRREVDISWPSCLSSDASPPHHCLS